MKKPKFEIGETVKILRYKDSDATGEILNLYFPKGMQNEFRYEIKDDLEKVNWFDENELAKENQ